IAARLLERALAVHHPHAGRLAELLDEACRDRDAHGASTSSGAGAAAGGSGGGAPSAAGGGAGGGAANSAGVTFALPASIPSAITRVISVHARIASSL